MPSYDVTQHSYEYCDSDGNVIAGTLAGGRVDAASLDEKQRVWLEGLAVQSGLAVPVAEEQ